MGVGQTSIAHMPDFQRLWCDEREGLLHDRPWHALTDFQVRMGLGVAAPAEATMRRLPASGGSAMLCCASQSLYEGWPFVGCWP